MKNKVKIKISESAYKELIYILKDLKGSYIRFAYKNGCCLSSKIHIYIDSLQKEDIIDKIDELPIIYNSQLTDNINEITLIYKNSTFMIKTVPVKRLSKDCSTCTIGCSHGCSHKNKMAAV
ncbi:hypothetical protein M2651_09805 [Clostridium sp. SYSU_GA19001]|uniref:hypothetical protein n=1 Tax=Clostridium caldaquaticum TaxID=2940653 RepID=UPI00207797CA|nr:hypothetical protein [Clostridium caldaquaticum]MCM8711325.1 hypothetical protein [Clostridium caldaquaticum]